MLEENNIPPAQIPEIMKFVGGVAYKIFEEYIDTQLGREMPDMAKKAMKLYLARTLGQIEDR